MKTAFIIDDDPFSLFLAKQILKLANVFENVVLFSSGEEALQALSNQEHNKIPDVILLDINMPLMNGWEFLNILQANYQEVIQKCKIYLLTSSLDGVDNLRMADYACISDLIYKPLTLEDIQLIVGNPDRAVLF